MLSQTWTTPYGYVVLVGQSRSLHLDKAKASEYAAKHHGRVYPVFLRLSDWLLENPIPTTPKVPYEGPDRRA